MTMLEAHTESVDSIDTEDCLLTLTEACMILGVSKQTIRRWTREGRLPYVRINNRGDRRFYRSQIEAFLRPRITGRPMNESSNDSSPS